MIPFLRHLIGWIIGFFLTRQKLILENLALRQQLLALNAKRPRRRLSPVHKFFWVALLRLWSGWKQSLYRGAAGGLTGVVGQVAGCPTHSRFLRMSGKNPGHSIL
jgi:hypothetical protein